ncbi:hypothetical protein HZA97_07380 [Candidatus Woesearchaeota archaeon]|nr:hypothetical protein [Candidatus Woesearchaeota archaeon]
MEEKIDYKILADLTPLTLPYCSSLEAIKYENGKWRLSEVVKSYSVLGTAKSPRNTQETLAYLEKLRQKVKEEQKNIERAESQLEFMLTKQK